MTREPAPERVADTIRVLPSTAESLSEIGIGDFEVVELHERLAWVVLVLRALEDRPNRFPHGKWATIQSIRNAAAGVRELGGGGARPRPCGEAGFPLGT